MTTTIRVPWLPFGWDGLALKWVIFHKGKEMSDGLANHERIHIIQQTTMGLGVYLWRYVTNKQFRFDVEYAAYRLGHGYSEEKAEARAKRYV